MEVWVKTEFGTMLNVSRAEALIIEEGQHGTFQVVACYSRRTCPIVRNVTRQAAAETLTRLAEDLSDEGGALVIHWNEEG